MAPGRPLALSETEKITRLTKIFGNLPADGVAVGIGDDAAVLAPDPVRSLVWTVDVQVEHVHFLRAWMTLADLGWRSFVAAASDLAAMGAEPWCALSSLVLPPGFTDDELDVLAEGQAEAALAVGAPIVGGNLSRGSELSITTTLLGKAVRPVRRSGARAGDGVWLAGEVGLAAAGLHALRDGVRASASHAAVNAFRRPKVRVHEGLALGPVATAAIDVSDGLAIDAGRLAVASSVAIVLDDATLAGEAHESARWMAAHRAVPLATLLLEGGEDYALLATSPVPIAGFRWIGEVRDGDGVWLRDETGERAVPTLGFDHFARA